MVPMAGPGCRHLGVARPVGLWPLVRRKEITVRRGQSPQVQLAPDDVEALKGLCAEWVRGRWEWQEVPLADLAHDTKVGIQNAVSRYGHEQGRWPRFGGLLLCLHLCGSCLPFQKLKRRSGRFCDPLKHVRQTIEQHSRCGPPLDGHRMRP